MSIALGGTSSETRNAYEQFTGTNPQESDQQWKLDPVDRWQMYPGWEQKLNPAFTMLGIVAADDSSTIAKRDYVLNLPGSWSKMHATRPACSNLIIQPPNCGPDLLLVIASPDKAWPLIVGDIVDCFRPFNLSQWARCRTGLWHRRWLRSHIRQKSDNSKPGPVSVRWRRGTTLRGGVRKRFPVNKIVPATICDSCIRLHWCRYLGVSGCEEE